MLSLRRKLNLAFGGMLAILVTVSALSSLLLNRYSATLEQLIRENDDSVVFGQGMKDSLGGLDGILRGALAEMSPGAGEATAAQLAARFSQNLDREKHNITVSGEAQIASELQLKWERYREEHEKFIASTDLVETRRSTYLRTIAPLGAEIQRLCQRIIDLNLANIVSVDGQVRESARLARRAMGALLVAGVLIAILLTTLIGRTILKPLRVLTQSAREIEGGNLDLVVQVRSRDEVGQLAESFNSMAAKLREFRRSDRAKLVRVQRTTQLALNSFPDAVAVIGLDGKVELSNDVAQRRFGLVPEFDLSTFKGKGLWDIFQKAFVTLSPVHPTGYDAAVQIFDGGNELFYLPQAVPILQDDKTLVGVTLVLADVTDLRRLDEMKSGLISVVSHELRTPLTSIRMATHLLLEERVGPLTPKQTELLLAAREDEERLNGIIERLLDMSRIESGRALMEFTPTRPEQLVAEAAQTFAAAFRDRGVALISEVGEDLPDVLADTNRIGHVFSNLLDNALKYTSSGGSVRIVAHVQGDGVQFQVCDSGRGIPEDQQQLIFQRFYRAPNQEGIRGAGLGLAIAREIVEAHGGSMSVQSRVGEGSTFSFSLKSAHKTNTSGVSRG